jgi:predicted Zn-dependent protease
MRYHATALVLLIITGSVLLTGCNPKSLVSNSQEISIGKEAAAQVESQYKVDKDSKLNALVNNIGQNLVTCCDRQDITYTFKVLDVKEVNAFSLPGGWVYVYKGLVDATDGDTDQLAGVIAHEIGHVAARHQAQAIGRELQASILIGTLTHGQTQQIAGLFANLQLLHYSREQEYEADKLGIKEMWRCRNKGSAYNAQGLVDFFAVLQSKAKKNPSDFERMLSDHPVTSERIKRAQTYLDDLKSGKAKP